MITNNKTTSLLLIVVGAIILHSCFPKDEVQPLIPFEGIVGSCSHSVYEYQSFFSLTDSIEISFNENTDWDIGFESQPSGKNIVLNGGNQVYATNLGNVDFISTSAVPHDTNWIFDASSGNPDSLAIKDWVNIKTSPYAYTQNVYMVRKVTGNNINYIKKFKIIELSNLHYKIVISDLASQSPDTIDVLKDNSVNYVKASINSSFIIQDIEPPKEEWDINFLRYATIIPDDNGTPTPYFVNGVYINPLNIEVAEYYISTDSVPEYPTDKAYERSLLKKYFESNFIIDIPDSLYSTAWDIIGYDWKEYTPDGEYKYTVDQRKVYIIRDKLKNKTYKFRFISFTDKPLFQYGEIKKGLPKR